MEMTNDNSYISTTPFDFNIDIGGDSSSSNSGDNSSSIANNVFGYNNTFDGASSGNSSSGTSSNTQRFIACCKVCGSVTGLRRCSRCKSVYYCSQVHQQVDWRVHKIECKKYPNEISGNSEEQEQEQEQEATETMKIDQQEQLQQEPQQNDLHRLHAKGALVNLVPTQNNEKKLQKNGDLQKYEDYKRLAENTMKVCNVNVNLMENSLASSELRYDNLCKQIISDMNTYGMCVVDDFLGMTYGLGILNEVHSLYEAGIFQNGQVASKPGADVKTIRGDKITWVTGTETHCQTIGFLINQIDTVVISANRMKDNGSLGKYKIRERTKAMVACYPSTGSHYILHVDNPNRDGRVITAIYYLNLHWDATRSGGALRIFPEHGTAVADIEPKFDRIIFFWSDRRNPHEVQPSHRTRYAITVWYFDADEREEALLRYKR